MEPLLYPLPTLPWPQPLQHLPHKKHFSQSRPDYGTHFFSERRRLSEDQPSIPSMMPNKNSLILLIRWPDLTEPEIPPKT